MAATNLPPLKIEAESKRLRSLKTTFAGDEQLDCLVLVRLYSGNRSFEHGLGRRSGAKLVCMREWL